MATRDGRPERRRRQRRVTQRGRESLPGATRRAGHERRTRESDPELREIRRLYAQLVALQRSGQLGRQSDAYKHMVTRIRALVDERTLIRGDEMIVVAEKVENFKG